VLFVPDVFFTGRREDTLTILVGNVGLIGSIPDGFAGYPATRLYPRFEFAISNNVARLQRAGRDARALFGQFIFWYRQEMIHRMISINSTRCAKPSRIIIKLAHQATKSLHP